ncbi:hypothetical protein ACFPRL_09670 [Pseudoclavibacter helvolus]
MPSGVGDARRTYQQATGRPRSRSAVRPCLAEARSGAVQSQADTSTTPL